MSSVQKHIVYKLLATKPMSSLALLKTCKAEKQKMSSLLYYFGVDELQDSPG